MTRIAVCAVMGAGVAVWFNGSVSDPASWALVLAGVAGGGFLGSRVKRPIGIEG